MADIFALDIAKSTVEKLVVLAANKVVEEANNIRHFEDYIRKVETALRELQGLLNEFNKFSRDQHSTMVVRWISKLCDQAVDAEDVIEICTHISPCSNGRLKKVKNIFLKQWFKRNMSIEIKRINDRLEDLLNQAQTLQALKMAISPTTKAAASFSPLSVEGPARIGPVIYGESVGMKTKLKDLEELLTEHNVAVVGMGGSGKTRLLQEAYKKYWDKKNKENAQYQEVIWLSVSSTYTIKELQTDLLAQLKIRCQDESAHLLQHTIYNELKKSKCLIMLDDVWEVSQPEQVRMHCHSVRDSLARIGLPLDSKFCRLLISTRNQKVATQMRAHVYRMEKLSQNDCINLFMKETGLSQKKVNSIKRKHVKAALEKCHGLPKAVMAVAAVMRNEGSGKIAAALQAINKASSQNANVVFHVLRPSFDSLDDRYKPCFAFMGILGEKEKIEEELLLGMWVAERLVPTHLDAERALDHLHSALLVDRVSETEISIQGFNRDLAVSLFRDSGGMHKCFNAVDDPPTSPQQQHDGANAHGCFNWSCFPTQDNQQQHGGNAHECFNRSCFSACRHPTAADNQRQHGVNTHGCFNWSCLSGRRQPTAEDNDPDPDDTPRRTLRLSISAQSMKPCVYSQFSRTVRTLCLTVQDEAGLSFIKQGRGLRVLSISLEKDPIPSSPSFLQHIVGKLTLLRYLHLEYPNMTELPGCIQDLHLLEYLILGKCKIDEVPPWIGKLEQLTYLSFSMQEGQPNVIWRCLAKPTKFNKDVQAPQGRFQHPMKNLQVVKGITIELKGKGCMFHGAHLAWTWELLGNLPKLRHISLKFPPFTTNQILPIKCPFTNALRYLDMTVIPDPTPRSPNFATIPTIPDEWQREPLSLQHLALRNIELPPILTMSWLYELRVLKLAAVHNTYPKPLRLLPQLRILEISDDELCGDLPSHYFKENKFPSLETLHLEHLEKFSKLEPLHKDSMPCLRELRIKDCNTLEEVPDSWNERLPIHNNEGTLRTWRSE